MSPARDRAARRGARCGPLSRVGALALAVGLCLGAPSARAGDAPRQRWELEVERETADQTAILDEARRRKGLDAVVARYESRLGRDPSVLNRFLLGRAQYWNGDAAAARRQMELCLREDPGFYFARVRLAILLLEQKDAAGAEREATAVLAARPDLSEAREVLTKVAVDRRDWDRALRLLNERLDRAPDDQRVRSLLVRIHLERKDVESALREARILRARDASNPEHRLLFAICLVEKGDLDAAAAELESLARSQPGNLDVLERLRGVHARRKDWEKARAAAERMLPHVDDATRKELLAYIEELKRGPGARRPEADPAAAAGEPRLDWPQVFKAAEGPDLEVRRRALRMVLEGMELGLLSRIDGRLLGRVHPEIEPDLECRLLAVRLHGAVAPPELPLLQIGLHDAESRMRTLTAETMGDLGDPLAVVYLLPFLDVEAMDVFEYQVLRDALSRLTGFVDLPPGTTGVTDAAGVAASREAWRRWSYATESRDVKRKAVDALLLAGKREPQPERYLYRFVLDPDFEVMSSAYRAMRDVVARGGVSPLEKRLFPTFPAVPDAEVTRAGMRALQDRVAAWWATWVAERRAALLARPK